MDTKNATYLFSSESVTEGHPDKLCDQISDAILDAHLEQDPHSHVACETFALKDTIIIGGEITSSANVNIIETARNVIKNIGYTNTALGLDYKTCNITTAINKQSPEIAQGVNQKEQGAGDQGIMFGFACNETPELMPLPISIAHKLTLELASVRKNKILPWVRPDGKAQVTVKYVNDRPQEITTVVLSTQHDPTITYDQIKSEILNNVIIPICAEYITDKTKYFINPTGSFVCGGPHADAGLTGRKIIVDTYGGMGRHGGGCFSGKDPSKVDRSAAYMARYIAKNIVAAKLADKCEVQIAYSIGMANPVSIYVNTFGTAKVDETLLEPAIRQIFPLCPAQIIQHLQLKNPIYLSTASYGHFGRTDSIFEWEKTNKYKELQEAIYIETEKIKQSEITI